MVPVINERIDRLFECFDEAMRIDKAILLNNAFSALAADVVIYHLFGEHHDFVSNEGFESPIPDSFQEFANFYHLARFVPGLFNFLRMLPFSVARLVSPRGPAVLNFNQQLRKKVEFYSETIKTREISPVVSMLLNNPSIPNKEKSLERIFDEATIFIGAGTETLSRAMRVGIFYVLSDKSILACMREELATLPPPQNQAYILSQLEALPYLVSSTRHFQQAINLI